MNFGLAFSYVFKDKDWFKKILMPALCMLIPVVGQFVVIGWGLKITKRVIDGYEEDALPNLEFGADLKNGFLAAVIQTIYFIPIGIIIGIAGGMLSFGMSDEGALYTILMILGGCIGLVGLLLAILIAFLSVAGVANFVAKGVFGAAFRIKEVFGLVKKAFGSWLLYIIIQSLVVGIIAPLGAIACFVGVFLTAIFANAVNNHLLGQVYNKATTPALESVEVL
ncbi:MAG TPA: DUF4013 domain-containing protein [Brevefilum sp.]|nr:DUF4013 domain-containing protein [Brevefilum sp.]HOR19450.1 DUF4013 domain-containing protein [Brevefilum sp.]HPL69983.1 DUF4013 domain-containing protein [Brevefilum sp.]